MIFTMDAGSMEGDNVGFGRWWLETLEIVLADSELLLEMWQRWLHGGN